MKKVSKIFVSLVLLISFFPTLIGTEKASANVGIPSNENLEKLFKHESMAYIDPSYEGVLTSTSQLYVMLNQAKKQYIEFRKEIVSSHNGNKNTQLKLLDSVYEERITKGLVAYIDAMNYATKYLDPIMEQIHVAEQTGDLDKLEKEYHKLSYQLKDRSSILYRFRGKVTRDLILSRYKLPADNKRTELIIPVTIIMKTNEAELYMKEGKIEEAKKIMLLVEGLMTKLPSNSTNLVLSKLIKEVVDIEKQLETQTTPVPNPGSGSEVSISTIQDVIVKQGLVLPKTVTAKMSNGATKSYSVVWPEQSTLIPGEFTAEIQVNGKKYTIHLTVMENSNYVDAMTLQSIIETLPEVITIINYEEINRANDLFESLNDEALSFINVEVQKKLEKLVQMMEDQIKVENVIGKINSLPEVTDLTSMNINTILETKLAYEGLSEQLRLMIPATLIEKLQASIEWIAIHAEKQALIQAANDALGQLPSLVDVKVETLGATQALIGEIHGKIDAAISKGAILGDFPNYTAFLNIISKVDALKVEVEIANLIGPDDSNLIEIRNHYDSLSEEQQSFISNYSKLLVLEDATKFSLITLNKNGEVTLPYKVDVEIIGDNGWTYTNGLLKAPISETGRVATVQLKLSLDGNTWTSSKFDIVIPATDLQAPIAKEGFPRTLNMTKSSVTVEMAFDEKAIVQALLVEEDGTEDPSINDLILEDGPQKRIATVEKDSSFSFVFEGLSAGKTYTLFYFAEDESGNKMKNLAKYSISIPYVSTLESLAISNFDYATIFASQAVLVSKPISSSNFQGNSKKFTIYDGTNTINVDLWWNIPQNEYAITPAMSIGSAVESYIQMNNLNGRATWASSFGGDTFQIGTFNTGKSAFVQVSGPNWNEFFYTDRVTGSDEDTSKNRSFSISDGLKIAEINLNDNYYTMDQLVDSLNSQLTSANVKVEAIKKDDNHFILKATELNVNITVDGTDKNEFF
ncbi:Ig-like domain-containing protein [Psychrobacillus sp. NPDC058041]|uniref:Ig-like domain-containing protein n=1 Tax=Psychrobacillus sp. NPDC058041 TaxID=3346310 RepID=UPI0036D7EC20